MLKVFIFFFLYITTCCQSSEIVRRAAFDIGSGKIKIQVADVDIATNKIVNFLFNEMIAVELGEDLAKNDRKLSREIQDKAIFALMSLKNKALQCDSKAFAGIATESMRQAKNREELIHRIKVETGIPIMIISQEEEGILGFMTAVGAANVNPDIAISWDTGAGSFQFAAKFDENYLLYTGKLGRVTMKNLMLRIQGKEVNLTPNPISRDESERAIELIGESIKEIPEAFREKLRQDDVKVLALGLHPFGESSQNRDYNFHQLVCAVNENMELNDDALIAKHLQEYQGDQRVNIKYLLTSQILFYGLMKTLGISCVQYVGTHGGNAVGVLLSPKYWP